LDRFHACRPIGFSPFDSLTRLKVVWLKSASKTTRGFSERSSSSSSRRGRIKKSVIIKRANAPYLCVYTHTHTRAHTHTHTHTHTRTYIHTYVSVCVCVRMCVCVYIKCMHLCICICGVTYYAYAGDDTPCKRISTLERRARHSRSTLRSSAIDRARAGRAKTSFSQKIVFTIGTIVDLASLSDLLSLSLFSRGFTRGALARRAFFPFSAPSFPSPRGKL